MLTIADYFAEWCGPCKVMEPVMEAIAKEYAGRVMIEKIDVDREQEKASSFGIQSIPTLVFMKDGKEVDRVVGAQSKDSIERLLIKHA